MSTPNKVFKERIKILDDATKIQVTAYTDSNYDSYMHGMSNGLIMALAIMQGQDDEIHFLESFDSKQELDDKAEILASRPKKAIPYEH